MKRSLFLTMWWYDFLVGKCKINNFGQFEIALNFNFWYFTLPQELQELVLKLREDLISVQVGKEMVEGELQFLKDQMKMIEEEKHTIEEGLNAEIHSLR